jgi:hypothetical protein
MRDEPEDFQKNAASFARRRKRASRYHSSGRLRRPPSPARGEGRARPFEQAPPRRYESAIRHVDVLVTPGNGVAAAHRATTTVPIVYLGDDLVGAGLVAHNLSIYAAGNRRN